LEPQSRAFALVLLAKGGLEIESAYRTELVSTLLTLGNWHLVREPVGRSLLGTEDSFEFLMAQLNHPGSEIAERAAEQLFNIHRSRLSSRAEAKCTALRTQLSGWPWELAKLVFIFSGPG
jgi:hypothetical protein